MVGVSASVPPAQQWLTHLIDEAHRSRKLAAQHQSVLSKLKSSFAIEHMSAHAYGKTWSALKPDARKAYLRLMEAFFEKAVIKALFHAKAGEEKVTYQIFPIKPAQISECATKIVGTVDHEQRVDWTIQKAQAHEEIYETKFCIRTNPNQSYEIVDIVVEGVSWVQDLAEEIERFYQEAKTAGKKVSAEHIHNDLMKKLTERIKKLDQEAQAGHS